jgi:hypothetical protein
MSCDTSTDSTTSERHLHEVSKKTFIAEVEQVGTHGRMNTDTAEQINAFAGALSKPDDLIEARGVLGRNGKARTLFYCNAANLVRHTGELLDANANGWNIYVGLNPKRSRATGDDNVLLARCLYADRDDMSGPDFEPAGMPPPTVKIWSGHGEHWYWRLIDTVNPAAWREWQKDLAAMLGTDPKVCNPERISRLPGFNNLKKEPAACYIMECDSCRVYDLADLPVPMREGSDTVPPVFTIRCVRSGNEGNRFKRSMAYLAKSPDAVSGEHGHDRTYAAACICNRFGLSREEALEAMRWFSAHKSVPPWSEKEVTHKVASAYAKNVGEHGEKLREDRQHGRAPFTIRKRGAA